MLMKVGFNQCLSGVSLPSVVLLLPEVRYIPLCFPRYFSHECASHASPVGRGLWSGWGGRSLRVAHWQRDLSRCVARWRAGAALRRVAGIALLAPSCRVAGRRLTGEGGALLRRVASVALPGRRRVVSPKSPCSSHPLLAAGEGCVVGLGFDAGRALRTAAASGHRGGVAM